MSYSMFKYAFTNGLAPDFQAREFQRHIVAESGRIFSRKSPIKINFGNAQRPPLLIIGGRQRHNSPGLREQGQPQAVRPGRSCHRLQGVPRPLSLDAGPAGLGRGCGIHGTVAFTASRRRLNARASSLRKTNP